MIACTITTGSLSLILGVVVLSIVIMVVAIVVICYGAWRRKMNVSKGI